MEYLPLNHVDVMEIRMQNLSSLANLLILEFEVVHRVHRLSDELEEENWQ